MSRTDWKNGRINLAIRPFCWVTTAVIFLGLPSWAGKILQRHFWSCQHFGSLVEEDSRVMSLLPL